MKISLLLLVFVAAGCTDETSYPEPLPDVACAVSALITPVHGHVLPMTLADINAERDRTYDIRGTADHTHEVTFAADDFREIKTRVETEGGFSGTFIEFDIGHTITLSCM